MNLPDLLKQVCELRAKGIKTVDLERLESALTAVGTAEQNSDEWRIKMTELKHQSDLAGYAARQDSAMRMLDAAIFCKCGVEVRASH